MREHDADARQPLRRGAVLARRALAVAAPGHRHLEAARLHGTHGDRRLAPAGKAGVREARELVVVVGHDRHRRDLVGGHVVAQSPCGGERELLAAKLRAHALRIVGEIQDAGRGAEIEDVHAEAPSAAR